MLFQGTSSLNLDAKGRIAIPARHRNALAPDGAPVVITAHPHKCLLIYPEPAWTPLSERLASLPDLEERAARLKRTFLGHAQHEIPDATGRVLISPSLRQWADLGKQLWLVGQGSHFELWSDEGWQKQVAAMQAIDTSALPPGFENFVL